MRTTLLFRPQKTDPMWQTFKWLISFPLMLLLGKAQMDVQLRQLLGALHCLELNLVERLRLRAVLVQSLLGRAQMDV
jgi:hypothetical protein